MAVFPGDWRFRDRVKYTVWQGLKGATTAFATGWGVGFADRLGVGDLRDTIMASGFVSTVRDVTGYLERNEGFNALVKGAYVSTLAPIPFKIGYQMHRKGIHLKHTGNMMKRLHPEPGFNDNAHRGAVTAYEEAYKPSHERSSFGNWRYREHYSNDRMAVWENHHNKHWHVAFRGTAEKMDIMHDLKIVSGQYLTSSDFFSNMKEKLLALMRMHSATHPTDGVFTISGHSLGGSMVNHMMSDPEIAKYISDAQVFNPGHGAIGNLKNLPKHLHIHINNADIAAFMADGDSGATFHYHQEETDTYNPITYWDRSHWHEGWTTPSHWNEFDYGMYSSAYEATVEPIIETATDHGEL